MASACCCYIVNQGYLFPTLLSALQARDSASSSSCDIVIVCVGEATGATAAYQRICESNGIKFMHVTERVIDGNSIAFARFYLHRILDGAYQSVLYLDGDTQICGGLDELLAVEIPKGKFLAALDPMSILYREGRTAYHRSYHGQLGLPEQSAKRYCNSGVLRFSLEDWPEISRRALDTSRAHNHKLRFPDQDPLNIVYGADYLAMSYKWNFPAFFLNSGFQHFIMPRIYHFMSNPRPWDGPFMPWGRAWFEPYRHLSRRFPELEPMRKPIGILRYLKYALQQRYKRVVETPLWASPAFHSHVRTIEHEAYF